MMEKGRGVDQNKNVGETGNKSTRHSYLEIYRKKSIKLDFRASIDYLEKLDKIASIINSRNLSETIRDAIDIAYGVLSGAKKTDIGTVVVQSPIVNINKLEAKAESRVDVKIDVSSLLAELDELKEMIYSWHRHGAIPKAAVKTATAKIKSIEKMIKGVN